MATENDASHPMLVDEPDSHATAPTSAPNSTPAPNGRSRISLACGSCRARKTKCDGIRPACSTCQHIGATCIYSKATQPGNRRGSSSRARIMLKIRELEDRLRSVDEDTAPVFFDDTAAAPAQRSEDRRVSTDYQADHDRGQVDLDLERDTSDDNSTVDVQAAKIFRDQNASDIGYFGPSSNHAFFRSVSRAFAQILRGTLPQQNQGQVLSMPTQAEIRQEFGISPTARANDSERMAPSTSPSMSNALQMIDRFFASSGTNFTFLNKSVLTATLQELASERRTSQTDTKRALLYMVFALSQTATSDPGSAIYFDQSMKLLTPARLRSANLTLVQVLLLQASYQQQNQMSVGSWTCHALAVKAAFQLGLHCPISYKELSMSDAALRTRAWYSLINQDRTLCMCLGRPCLIPAQYVCTPKLQDPRLMYRHSSSLHDHHIESLLHHKYQTDLYSVVASMLSTMYEDNIEREEPLSIWVLLSSRLQLFRQFEEWRCSLDHRLRPLTGQELDTILTAQSDITWFRLSLSIHWYRALVILNGSVLTRLLELAVNDSRPEDDADTIFDQCAPIVKHEFTVLHNLQDCLSAVLTRGEGFIDQNNAWWLCNHTGSVVTMHFFCLALLYRFHSMPATSVGVPATEIRRLLGESVDNMKMLQRSSTLALKAREVLEKFIQIFDSTQQRQQLDSTCNFNAWVPPLLNYDTTEIRAQNGGQTAGDFIDYLDFDSVLGSNVYC